MILDSSPRQQTRELWAFVLFAKRIAQDSVRHTLGSLSFFGNTKIEKEYLELKIMISASYLKLISLTCNTQLICARMMFRTASAILIAMVRLLN